MTNKVTRREFLKLMSLASLSYALPKRIPYDTQQQNPKRENILIVLFDAWSAANISLQGYRHPTTPYLEQLAEKAIVYHNHFAGGHFTPPGTASLLTGTLPWRHRAFNYETILDQDFLEKNIFHAFDEYYRFAYSHNPLAHYLLAQFVQDIDDLTSWEKLYFEYDPLILLFRNDQDISSVGWNRTMKRQDDGYAYSLYYSLIYEKLKARSIAPYANQFPRGVPSHDRKAFYTLEHGIDGLLDLTQAVAQPFLGYYHFFPPHDPYNTRKDFFNQFNRDDYVAPGKPLQIFENVTDDYLTVQRRYYDEFILYVDAEFARLYQQLERSGLLENTWIILTTDHGEMFERGILGHTAPVFYQPLIHIPLMVFPPGQKERVDIFDKTSAVDILPTLMEITGQGVPEWTDGQVLPPFSDRANKADREITSVQVEKIEDGKIMAASAMCVRDNYKVMWFFGYDGIDEGGEIIELYDIDADPEERQNLYPAQKEIADELVGLLRLKMDELNRAYKTKS